MPSATNVSPLIRSTTRLTFGRARTLRGRPARALHRSAAGLTIFRMAVVQGLSTTPVAGELLERAGELAALTAALDAVARERRGQLVLVRGEAGAGKTMLVRCFCDGVTGADPLQPGVVLVAVPLQVQAQILGCHLICGHPQRELNRRLATGGFSMLGDESARNRNTRGNEPAFRAQARRTLAQASAARFSWL